VREDGRGVEETLAAPVPTAVEAPATVAAAEVAATVVLAYTGAEVATATTLEVDTGLTMVQGQLVMVMVSLSVVAEA